MVCDWPVIPIAHQWRVMLKAAAPIVVAGLYRQLLEHRAEVHFRSVQRRRLPIAPRGTPLGGAMRK